MPTHVIVSQGQLIQTDLSKTIQGFSSKIAAIEGAKNVSAEGSVLEQKPDGCYSIKESIQKAFIGSFARLRVNGLAEYSADDSQDERNAKNEQIFRNETRKLFNLTSEELSDEEFDHIWCLMCIVEEGHARRYQEVLAYPHAIIHSGTNSIQARHIAKKLKEYGIEVPASRLFLSFVHRCEYVDPNNNLIRVMYDSINPTETDRVILIQSATDSVPQVFQPVSHERYQSSSKFASDYFPRTTVVGWNNKAVDANGFPALLIESLVQQQYIEQMRVAFFMSSVSDTQLAKETIKKLAGPNVETLVFPLTKTAEDQLGSFVKELKYCQQVRLPDDLFNLKKYEPEALERVAKLVAPFNLDYAYVGVPSPVDQEGAMQIAEILKMPCTVVYDFMFEPIGHQFWQHVPALANKPELNFAVALPEAAKNIQEHAPGANTVAVGHLCFNRSSHPLDPKDVLAIKEQVSVNADDTLTFIAGTTQPSAVDCAFIEALLSELASNDYPHLQLRFTIHPGVQDLNSYVDSISKVCNAYPSTQNQFKILVTEKQITGLNDPSVVNNAFFMPCELKSVDIANAASKVAQAVPGALLNEAVLDGKPGYFHQKARAYLPSQMFAQSIKAFLTAEPSGKKSDLGVAGNVVDNLSQLLNRIRLK